MQEIRITSSNIPIILLITAFQKAVRSMDQTFSLLYWKFEDNAIIFDFYAESIIQYAELRRLIDRYIENNRLNSQIDFSIIQL